MGTPLGLLTQHEDEKMSYGARCYGCLKFSVERGFQECRIFGRLKDEDRDERSEAFNRYLNAGKNNGCPHFVEL